MAKKKTITKKVKTGEENGKAPVKKEPSEDEKACITNYRERSKRKPLKFENTKGKSDTPSITPKDVSIDVALAKMTEALGTADCDLQNYLLFQVNKVCRGLANREGYDFENMAFFSNAVMAILNGIRPQDEIEGMLAVQMIGVHNLAMETLQRAILVGQTDEGKELNVNQATKMLRTFIAQIDALKNYRTGGQQKMIVEHVHVNEGGQAFVGQVNPGGVKNDKRE